MLAFRISIMCLGIICTLGSAFGKGIESLHVRGFSEPVVQTWLSLVGGEEDIDPAAIVGDSLICLGYLECNVYQHGDTIFVNTGKQYHFRSANVSGDSAVLWKVSNETLPWSRSGEFDLARITESANEILSWCESNGYPYARVEIDSFSVNADSHFVTPYVRVLAGPLVSIDFIGFEGNDISQSWMLAKESRLKNGMSFNQLRVQSAHRRLSQLEFIRSVREPRIVVGEAGRTGIVFEVEENKLSRLDLVAGLSPRNDIGEQTFTAYVDLQFLNLFGTGRRGKVKWTKPAKGIQELLFAWRETWLARLPLYLEGSFAQRVEDTLYVTRDYGARLGVPIASNTDIFGGVTRSELLADSAVASLLSISPHNTVFLELGILVDTRDHFRNPRSGYRFETSGSRGQRLTDSRPQGSNRRSFELRRAVIDLEFNHEVARYWIVHLSGHARLIESDEPRIQSSDRFRLGGANSLRGYREEQFLGSRIAWTSVEARYWLGLSSRVHFFTDWAAINDSPAAAAGTPRNLIRGAYGIGVRLETAIGVWGIDYGIADGSSPLNGQLHVSLLSLF